MYVEKFLNLDLQKMNCMLRWSKNGCSNKSVQNDVLKVCSSSLHAIQVIVLLSVTGLIMLLSVLLKMQGWKVAMGLTNNSNIVLPFPYSIVTTVRRIELRTLDMVSRC